MIDFSDKTQLTSFVAVVAAILCLLAVVIVFWTRMRKRLSGGAFAAWLTATIIILAAGIAACLTTIVYKTEFLKIDSEVVGNALAFEYDGNIVFSIPGLGVFFDVVFNYTLVEMLLYAVTLVDLALLVLVCIRRGVTRALYSGNCDGEGYYTVSEHEDEPGAFAVCGESGEEGTEPAAEKTESVVAVSEEPSAADETPVDETPVIESTAEERRIDTEAAVGEDVPEPAAEENAAADETDDEKVSPVSDMPAPLEEYAEDEESEPDEKDEIEEPVETDESLAIAEKETLTEEEVKVEPETIAEEGTATGAEKTPEEELAPEITEEPATVAETLPEEPETEVSEETQPEELVPGIETTAEPVNVAETEKTEAGTVTSELPTAAEPEEKTPDRAARFIAPVVAADKARRTSETATVARKNGRVTVKSRAAEMFDEYLGGRSAADREKLLDSIDVITKKND